jgi:hypothetical protein
MVLQHVPRSALLSIGVSRKVASMALVNAIFTVGGIVSGYILTKGSVPGAILGNALGNVAGCTWGVLTARRVGLRVGRAMLCYSLWFLALSLLGYAMAQMLVGELGWTEALASAVVTLVFGVPLSILVWIRVGRTLLSKRKPV